MGRGLSCLHAGAAAHRSRNALTPPRSPTRPQSQQRASTSWWATRPRARPRSCWCARCTPGTPARCWRGQPQLALLQVLRLADRLQAPRCVAAAATALAAAPALDWATVLAIWQLPEGCADQPAYAPVFEAAGKAVQARLGDLDAALADEGSRAALLALPLRALVWLLRSDETRASSENVAFFVCSAWLHERSGGGSEEEQRALAACLRLHHMSPLYLATVAGRAGWIKQRPECAEAAAFVAAPEAVKSVAAEVGRFTACAAPPRPASRDHAGRDRVGAAAGGAARAARGRGGQGRGRRRDEVLGHCVAWGGLRVEADAAGDCTRRAA